MAVKRITGHSGTYILLRQIGTGGMGAVWSANWIGHGNVVKPVVIKILHATEQTDRERERFLNEARIAAQLNHAGIVGIFDVGQIDGDVFLVMEWVDGRDLRYVLKTVGQPLGFPISCYIMGEVLKALAHAHDRTIGGAPAGVIHYDIKPENIMISSSGEVKLTDFGISRFAATADTLSRAYGTLRYMSPEQMFGRARVQTDIYSAGVVFYELLHNRRYLHDVPAERFQQAVLGGEIPELGGHDIAAWAVMLVRQMLAMKIEDRPRAVDALAVILEKTPFYQVGGQRLQELYAKSIGAKRSGVTGILDLKGFENAQVMLSSARRVPLPPNEHVEVQQAAPDDQTAAERVDEPADPDSPSILRRSRDRITPAEAVGGVDRVTGRTFTGRPPMLDAIPEPAMIEPASATVEPPMVESAMVEPELAVEPTELLPRIFADSTEPVVHSRPELDAPQGEGSKLPSGQPTPTNDISSGPLSIAVAPVSGPHPRAANIGIIVALGVLVAVLVGVVIGMAVSTKSASVEQQAAVGDGGTVHTDATTGEPPAETNTEREPAVATQVAPMKSDPVEPDPTQPNPTQPNPTQPNPTQPDPTPSGATPTADAKGDSTDPIGKVEPDDDDTGPVKPKPKPPSTTVYFTIDGGTAGAEISVGGRSLSYNGFAKTSLRAGKSYDIRWRNKSTEPWKTPGALKVEVLEGKKYLDVHLTASSMSVKTRQEGSGK